MEFFHQILSPHAPVLEKIASTLTFLQFISAGILVNNIRKKGSTKGFPAGPFLGGLVLTILGVKFGALIRDDAMIRVNILGFAINVIFVCIFYYYTPNAEKTKMWGKIGISGIVTGLFLLYAEFENPQLVEQRFGLIFTGILVCLVASPLLGLGEIIRTKNTDSLPFPMIVSGTFVAISWLLYGLAINNTAIVVQNLILGSLSASQLSLFVIFPGNGKTKPSTKKKSKKTN